MCGWGAPSETILEVSHFSQLVLYYKLLDIQRISDTFAF